MFELRVPFFKPLWRRILTVVLCFGWGSFELSNNAILWAMGFFALGVLTTYQFFFAWIEPTDPNDPTDPTNEA